MRRRVLQATVATVVVAVVLLGVPLALFGANFVHDNETRKLTARVEQVGRVVDGRLSRGETVDSALLQRFVGGAGTGTLPASIVVVTAQGDQVEAGDPVDGRSVELPYRTDANTIVVLTVSAWDVFWRSIQVVVGVVALCIIAVGAGIAMAVWQANRLAAPLVYLAASAQQLGSGQVRPELQPSGVEEIDLVAAELARSADHMAARLAVERQFASDASHQLRTPLTALSMRIEEIMLTAAEPEVQEEARKSLEQVERLADVVDDLLLRSRRASGGTTEVLRLVDLTDQQVDEWGPTFEAQGRRLRIDVPDDLQVLATPGGLAQVVATLVENSLKHGGGTTTIAAQLTGASKAVVLTVGDEGEGVDDSIAGRIFEREVTSGKGTGLGLALARDLVTADGGRLELSQRRPAVFSVFLSGAPSTLDPDAVMPRGRVTSVERRSRRGKGRKRS